MRTYQEPQVRIELTTACKGKVLAFRRKSDFPSVELAESVQPIADFRKIRHLNVQPNDNRPRPTCRVLPFPLARRIDARLAAALTETRGLMAALGFDGGAA